MPTPVDLQLLGLAEQLSVLEVDLGDPADQDQLTHLLDRCTDAIVDVAQGSHSLSRPDLPRPDLPRPDLPRPDLARLGAAAQAAQASRPVGPALHTVDLASLSALAAHCHRTARALGDRDSTALAGRVAAALTTTADTLQHLVQDLAGEESRQARARLRRGLRRAAAQLAPTEP